MSLSDQIPGDGGDLRHGLHEGHHALGGFHALGGVARAGGDDDVVLALAQVDGLGVVGVVDLLELGGLVLTDHADGARGVVDNRDEVIDHPASLADRGLQVVVIHERRHVALTLASHDGLAAGLVRLGAEACIMQARNVLHVLSVERGFLHDGRRERGRVEALGFVRAFPQQHRIAGPVGVAEAFGPALHVRRLRQPLSARGQGQQLRRDRAPVVQQALGVLGEPHQTETDALVAHPNLTARDLDDRQARDRQLVGVFKDLVGAHQIHAGRLTHDLADAGLSSLRLGYAGFELGFLAGDVLNGPIVQQGDLAFCLLDRPILGDPHHVARHPALSRNSVTKLGELNAGIALLEGAARNLVNDEAVPSIGPGTLNAHRVPDHREGIRERPDADVLVEDIVIDVLQVDPEVPEPARDLIFTRDGVDALRVAIALDGPHKAHADLGNVLVAVFSGQHADRRAVDAGVTDHLADELRQAVDGQAGLTGSQASGLDRLVPLFPTEELQVIQRRVGVRAVGVNALLKPQADLVHEVAQGFVRRGVALTFCHALPHPSGFARVGALGR